METNKILTADFLDILFEGRNKEYGAYELRKTYNKRINKALAATITGCLLVLLVSVITKSHANEKPWLDIKDEVTLTKADPIPPPAVPPPPPPPPPPAQIHVATIQFTKLVLTEDPVNPPPKQDDLNNVVISDITRPGDAIDVVDPPVELHIIGKVETPVTDDFKGEVFFVQKEAQFPGGANAWKKYLEKNLRSELPAENGATAGFFKVLVSFLVDKEGNISEVKAESDPGYGTASEAVRVIQRGPKWIPAVQNGRNVIYRQKQIVTFVIEENQ